jgi:TPR repeat protein
MENFYGEELEESFERFERAAAKGHEESVWLVSLVKDVEMGRDALKEAFAQTEEPLGWYWAGEFSEYEREQFDFYKKSAEGGCSWGQVEYGRCFRDGEFVEQDWKVYAEWLEKAANQNNPEAMYWLGDWFRKEGHDKQKTVSYYRAAAALGWKNSMNSLAKMLRKGDGCEKDLRQAVIWGAKGPEYCNVFWDVLGESGRALKSGATEDLDCDINQLCYSIGWGLYWYQDTGGYRNQWIEYYCRCVELQQKSIFTFLLFWNRTTGGIKGPGQMITKLVWEEREDNLVKIFEESGGEEPEMKTE